MRGGVAAALAAAVLSVTPAAAQDAPPPVAAPVLILDSDRLYLDSAYGQTIRDGLEAEAADLKAENDRIVAALTEEERSLTQRRPTMTPEAFRAEANAFDVKVQGIRRARDAKEMALEDSRLKARDDFFNTVRDIVGQLMLEEGATVILDRRSVFLALSAADMTEKAIARIDAAMLKPGPAPQSAPLPLVEGPTAPDGEATDAPPSEDTAPDALAEPSTPDTADGPTPLNP
ncbi:periplasmic chaperone for outer membrane proteins Skp [Loktanella atrilutea]|uniref:Periplasmic chaperone for outer membrane proteins Skp n=1 Tax=Loktanella atrilutea TaxID=366533 RepID=A0A1M4TP85_LOKAT|nr:OmpH family outer membrane protein [Loktanella atrilutea]SHE46204.1 periplasmic chaperone for outer membrane proteins Skp [Loktanella atrilutea]